MRHVLIACIALAAISVSLSVLLINWETGQAPQSASLSGQAVQMGRAATATDPANPANIP